MVESLELLGFALIVNAEVVVANVDRDNIIADLRKFMVGWIQISLKCMEG